MLRLLRDVVGVEGGGRGWIMLSNVLLTAARNSGDVHQRAHCRASVCHVLYLRASHDLDVKSERGVGDFDRRRCARRRCARRWEWS